MEGVVSMIPNREFKLNELSKINSSASEIDGIITIKDIEQITSITRGYIQNWNGVFVSSNNWRTSNFISVSEGEVIKVTSLISGTNADILIGYDDLGVFVSALLTDASYTNFEYTIPSGISKVRIVSIYNNIMSLTKTKSIPTQVKTLGKTWTSIGDSITFRYGYQPVVNSTLQFKNIINEGYSGKPLTNYGGQGSIIASTVGMIESDLYTIMAGTNDFKLNAPIGTTADYINNTGDTTFYGAFRQLIDRCYTLNSKCKIILFNILRRNNDSYTSYSTNVAGHTVSDYNAAIKWVAEREALELLDLFNTSGITDRNLGIYTEDGLHPNPLGYSLIAKQMTTKFYSIWQ